MKPYGAVLMFVTILTASVISSIGSYKKAEGQVVADLNNALAITLKQKRNAIITPDTIRTYRSNLSILALRNRAYVSYCLRNELSDIPCSKVIPWKTAYFRGYANCSFATIFSISDQRIPVSLSALAMLWGIFSLFYFRKKNAQLAFAYGGLSFNPENEVFLDSSKMPLHLTPMQFHLMRMFWFSARHQLSQEEICKTLWPKKDDPSETLYTLIRRLKTKIEPISNLKIEVERGKAYSLTEE